MDVMFGFFEQETLYDEMSPIALPAKYGQFSLLVGNQQVNFTECDPKRQFTTVDEEEKKVNFFGAQSLTCLDTDAIDIGGSGFIKGQLREIEIRFDACVNETLVPDENGQVEYCAEQIDFELWFRNKVFYMWSAGNIID